MDTICGISNVARKGYASLATAKGRRQLGLFMAQGTKCVLDTLAAFELHQLLCTDAWAREHSPQAATIVKAADLERISTLATAPEVIAIYRLPEPEASPLPHDQLMLALDCVQDPGNLGTIMRVADWMGVTTILASPDTADVWSPKVVQATMGAISRVRIRYTSLPDALSQCGLPVYGTFLEGENIYKSPLSAPAVIVMGNEGRGISPEVAKCVTRKISIPSFPPGRPTSESLNVAIATAITLSEFRRNG